MSKIQWRGTLTSVQPRIRLSRSFDQRSHSYLGYVLRIDAVETALDDEVLLDLLVRGPWCLVAPLGDEVSRDHRSTSMSVLIASRQRLERSAPVRAVDGSRGAIRLAWFLT